jgi:heme exporter protein B
VWRDALLVAGKDLRIERRSRVALQQVVPFAVLVVVLFAFALDPDRGVLARAAAGLFWTAVLFSSLLAVQRSQAVEGADGVRDAVRLSGLDPAAVFLGKALAVAAQLLVLEAILAAGLRVRETLLPLLLLPVVAPVLIAATRASESALTGTSFEVSSGDWLGLLAVFAALYVAFGLVAYGALLED